MNSSVLKKRIRWEPGTKNVLLSWKDVHTVCEESACPNRHECSAERTATFLIGGNRCTRTCRFCHVLHKPDTSVNDLQESEERAILDAVDRLKLNFAVITSVTRDDEPFELAKHFSNIVRKLYEKNIRCELLIPDFNFDAHCLDTIANSRPDVIAHNLETVERLSEPVRKRGTYEKSLQVLQHYAVKYPKIIVKSGLITGLGETMKELKKTVYDIRQAGVEILTIGQYLRPSARQMNVKKQYSVEEFEELKEYALHLGYAAVASGPFVRSSYRAAAFWKMAVEKK